MTSRRTAPGPRPGLVLVVLLLLAGTLAMGCDTGGSRERVSGRATGAAELDDDTGPAGAGRTRGRCRGVVIGTDQDPHRVLREHRAGTTFCLEPGVHRVVRPLVPEEGDTIAGVPGAVLNGSKVLTGWRRVGEGWSTSGRLPDEPSVHGECLPEEPECTYAEDVFLDGQRLSRASSADQVTPDSFFADYSTNTIIVGTDPTGRLAEQAVAPALVRSGRSGVTVRDLVIEKAANQAQEAAVDGRTDSPRTGARWRVVRNLVQLNHGVGVGIGTDGVVQDNVIRAQGQLGISVWEQGALVRGNEVVLNGTAGYDPEWEAGGLKAWETVAARFVGNQVHDNLGPGLWSDGGCHQTLYRRNTITGNWAAGIQHEISYDALIVRNRVIDNGRRPKGWAWDAGIQIQSSGGLGLITVRRNVVSGNPNGIMVLQSGSRRTELPRPHGPHVVRNVLVRHNRVALYGDEWTGLVHDIGGHAVFRRDIRFEANTYRVGATSDRQFAWEDELLTFDEWQASADQDRDGTLVVR